jgi:hypothetical protein
MLTIGVTSEEVANGIIDAWEALGLPANLKPLLVQPNIQQHPDWSWIYMQWTTDYELREVEVLFTRNFPGKPPEDYALFTIHLLNTTGGIPDASWTTADYEAAEALLDAFWTAIKDEYAPFGTTLAGYRWRADGPAFKPFGAALSPTLRTTTRNVAGTGTGNAMLPPQVAVTVTEVIPSTFTVTDVEGVGTQVRNRWGRFYLPAPHAGILADGRIGAAFLTDVADATKALYDGLTNADFPPVVYSPTTGHAWKVDEIHVDDVFDVIRSRRYRNTLARTPRTIIALD